MKWLRKPRDWLWYDIYGPHAYWVRFVLWCRPPKKPGIGWSASFDTVMLGENRIVRVGRRR